MHKAEELKGLLRVRVPGLDLASKLGVKHPWCTGRDQADVDLKAQREMRSAYARAGSVACTEPQTSSFCHVQHDHLKSEHKDVS